MATAKIASTPATAVTASSASTALTANPAKPASILLAIDTCTRRASLALRDATTLRAEITWECQRQHTAAVSAKIQDLLQTSQIDPAEIGAVAVAIGPGSFTGVRCGLAIGKGIATANHLPMIGLPAFEVIARAQPNTRQAIYALVEAGRSRVAVCRYEWVEGELVVADTWRVMGFDEWVEDIKSPAWVCGDLAPALLKALQARTKLKVEVAPAWLNLRRAGVLAELAYANWQRGEVQDAAAVLPIYPPE